MPQPVLIVNQSYYLIQNVDIDLHNEWQTVHIQISWLLQKPTDLDLHCLRRHDISGFSRTSVNFRRKKKLYSCPRWDQYWQNLYSIVFSDIQIHCYKYSNLTDENSYHLSTKSLELHHFGIFFSLDMTFKCLESIKTSYLGRETIQTRWKYCLNARNSKL